MPNGYLITIVVVALILGGATGLFIGQALDDETRESLIAAVAIGIVSFIAITLMLLVGPQRS